MKVKDIMTKQVFSVTENTALRKVNELFQRYRINGVTVVNEKDEVIGIVTFSDLIRQIFPSYEKVMEDESYWLVPKVIEDNVSDLINKPVGQIMQRKVITVEPDVPAVRAAALMVAHHVKQLPVVENGKLVGILGYKDITWGFMLKNCKYF